MKYHAMIILAVLLWLDPAAPVNAETPKMCGNSNRATPQKESAMFIQDLNTATEIIPPIDRTAPEKFETAAFGLG